MCNVAYDRKVLVVQELAVYREHVYRNKPHSSMCASHAMCVCMHVCVFSAVCCKVSVGGEAGMMRSQSSKVTHSLEPPFSQL